MVLAGNLGLNQLPTFSGAYKMSDPIFCGKILTDDETRDWHALRAELALFDVDAALSTLESAEFAKPDARPHLLFDAAHLPTMRDRLSQRPEVTEYMLDYCRGIVKAPADGLSNETNSMYKSRELVYEKGWNPQEIEFTFEGPEAEDLYILQTRDMITIKKKESFHVFAELNDSEKSFLGKCGWKSLLFLV